MFYIPQIQKDDCGFACLKMVLATLNKDKNYLFLPQEEDHGYYSYSDLISIAELYGVSFSAIRTTNKNELVNCPKLPLIVAITLDNGAKHAVIVIKVKGNQVTYIDPGFGKTTVKDDQFYKIWDGTALLIEKFVKTKYPHPVLNPIKKSTHSVLSLIQILSGIFAVVGVYFINDNTPIYVPIIFLSLAVIIELIMRVVSYRVMKKLDDYFFSEKRIPYDGFKEYLVRYENYKKLVLSSPMNYIMTLIFTLGLVAVMLINDYRNVLLVGTPITLCLVNLAFITPSLKKKKREIEEAENGIDYLKSANQLRQQANVLHKKAYAYSYINTISSYFIALIIIVMTLLTMHLCGISSLPYLVFYTCLSTVLYKSFDQLVSFDERIVNFNIAKVKINNRMRMREN